MNQDFWNALDRLVETSELIIDRPKNTPHPRYPNLIYPLDYGYLNGTSSMDGDGIDVWVGSEPHKQVGSIICIVDLMKKDSEIKLLIGCTNEEQQIIYEFHNNSEYMKGILIQR